MYVHVYVQGPIFGTTVYVLVLTMVWHMVLEYVLQYHKFELPHEVLRCLYL